MYTELYSTRRSLLQPWQYTGIGISTFENDWMRIQFRKNLNFV